MYHLRILSYEPMLATNKKVRRKTDIEGAQQYLTHTDLIHSYRDDETFNTYILGDEEFARYIANQEFKRIRKEKPLHSMDFCLSWWKLYGYGDVIEEGVMHFKKLPR